MAVAAPVTPTATCGHEYALRSCRVYTSNVAGQTQALCGICIGVMKRLIKSRAAPAQVREALGGLGYGREDVERFIADMSSVNPDEIELEEAS